MGLCVGKDARRWSVLEPMGLEHQQLETDPSSERNLMLHALVSSTVPLTAITSCTSHKKPAQPLPESMSDDGSLAKCSLTSTGVKIVFESHGLRSPKLPEARQHEIYWDIVS